jgi:hypothetical protein
VGYGEGLFKIWEASANAMDMLCVDPGLNNKLSKSF